MCPLPKTSNRNKQKENAGSYGITQMTATVKRFGSLDMYSQLH